MMKYMQKCESIITPFMILISPVPSTTVGIPPGSLAVRDIWPSLVEISALTFQTIVDIMNNILQEFKWKGTASIEPRC